MAKFYGAIGFEETRETAPGVWTENIVERNYYGDLIRNARRLQPGQQVNDDVTISNHLSIVADPYAQQNFHQIRYATFMGTKWKVSSVEVLYPRLTLELGGVYNGEQTGTAGDA